MALHVDTSGLEAQKMRPCRSAASGPSLAEREQLPKLSARPSGLKATEAELLQLSRGGAND
jgi:hypothetical protein